METPDIAAFVRADEGIIGWGRALVYKVSGADHFDQVSQWWESVLAVSHVEDPIKLPGTGPLLLASFTFDPQSDSSSVAIIPENIIGRHAGRTWFTKTIYSAEPSDASRARQPAVTITDSCPRFNAGYGMPSPSWGLTVVSEGALGADAFMRAVAMVERSIQKGKVSKAVVARDLRITADSPIQAAELLQRLGRQESAWIICVDGLIGASPEMLLRQRCGRIWSRVLAGSRPAGSTLTMGSMLTDASLLKEHGFSVRSVEEALTSLGAAPHATDPFPLTLSTVHHIATDITAQLEPDALPFRTLAALHPSAAVCGTPRKLARQLIRKVEGASGMDRERFSGPIGWTDSYGNADWCIALRCGILGPDQKSIKLYAGCGIVAGADPAAELQESEAKFRSMLTALGARGNQANGSGRRGFSP